MCFCQLYADVCKEKRQLSTLKLVQLKHALYWLPSKFIEDPHLIQIPSEDMDLEEIGSGSGSGPGSVCGSEQGSVCEDSSYRRRQSTASSDSVYDTESTTSSRESLIETSHSLSQVPNCTTVLFQYLQFSLIENVSNQKDFGYQ